MRFWCYPCWPEPKPSSILRGSAKAALLERDGLPKIDPLMGGRFWPALKTWFLRRHSVEFNTQPNELDAPGVELRERKNEARDQYWVATAAARTRGYLPPTAKLHHDLGGSAGRHDLEQRCRPLIEMLAWLADPADTRKPTYDWCRTLDRAIGKRRVDRESVAPAFPPLTPSP
jgi:hypothetical protein